MATHEMMLYRYCSWKKHWREAFSINLTRSKCLFNHFCRSYLIPMYNLSLSSLFHCLHQSQILFSLRKEQQTETRARKPSTANIHGMMGTGTELVWNPRNGMVTHFFQLYVRSVTHEVDLAEHQATTQEKKRLAVDTNHRTFAQRDLTLPTWENTSRESIQ